MDIECKWGERVAQPEGEHGASLVSSLEPCLLTPWPKAQSPNPTMISESQPKGSHRPFVCYSCKAGRSKCSQHRPTCERCILYKLPCDYPPPGRRRIGTVSESSRVQSQEDADVQSETPRTPISPGTSSNGAAQASLVPQGTSLSQLALGARRRETWRAFASSHRDEAAS